MAIQKVMLRSVWRALCAALRAAYLTTLSEFEGLTRVVERAAGEDEPMGEPEMSVEYVERAVCKIHGSLSAGFFIAATTVLLRSFFLLQRPMSTHPWFQFEYPWLGPHFAARPLDESGHVYVIDRFLTEDEVDHLRLVGGRTLPPESPHAHVSLAELARPWEAGADPVVALIEARIANLTGIAPHADESPLLLEVQRSWPAGASHAPSSAAAAAAAAAGAAELHSALRHDAAQRPQRVASVLVFLSDERDAPLPHGALPPDELLPCAAHDGTASHLGGGGGANALCSRLERALREGDGVLSPAGAEHPSSAPDAKPPPCFDRDAALAASGLCAAAGAPAGGARHLRISPRRGTALLVFTASPDDGRLLGHMWRGSCRVARGERWTLQAFKEAPPPGRQQHGQHGQLWRRHALF